jgi:hypothetical protein
MIKRRETQAFQALRTHSTVLLTDAKELRRTAENAHTQSVVCVGVAELAHQKAAAARERASGSWGKFRNWGPADGH